MRVNNELIQLNHFYNELKSHSFDLIFGVENGLNNLSLDS